MGNRWAESYGAAAERGPGRPMFLGRCHWCFGDTLLPLISFCVFTTELICPPVSEPSLTLPGGGLAGSPMSRSVLLRSVLPCEIPSSLSLSSPPPLWSSPGFWDFLEPSSWQDASAGPLPALSCPLMATLEPASDQILSQVLKVQQPREVGLVLNLVCRGSWERDRGLILSCSRGLLPKRQPSGPPLDSLSTREQRQSLKAQKLSSCPPQSRIVD